MIVLHHLYNHINYVRKLFSGGFPYLTSTFQLQATHTLKRKLKYAKYLKFQLFLRIPFVSFSLKLEDIDLVANM